MRPVTCFWAVVGVQRRQASDGGGGGPAGGGGNGAVGWSGIGTLRVAVRYTVNIYTVSIY